MQALCFKILGNGVGEGLLCYLFSFNKIICRPCKKKEGEVSKPEVLPPRAKGKERGSGTSGSRTLGQPPEA